MFQRAVFTVLALFLAVSSVFAFGLTVNPGEFAIENLKIGQSYDISKISRPFLINYEGSDKMDLVVDIYKPETPATGYEVIPDTGWVKIDKDVYTALPGESVQVTAVLTIPDDVQYLSKRYDVRLKVSAKPRLTGSVTGLAPAVETRIVFSIFQERGSPEEQSRFEEILQKSRNISFSPTELFVDNVPVGKSVDIKKELKKSLKLLNLNDEAMNIIIKKILPKDISLKISDYESLDDAVVVKFSKEKFKLKPNQVEEIKLFLKFPDKQEYRGKKYLLICEAGIDNELLSTQYRVRIFISTK